MRNLMNIRFKLTVKNQQIRTVLVIMNCDKVRLDDFELSFFTEEVAKVTSSEAT